MFFDLVFILQVGFVGVLFELHLSLIYGSWLPNNFDVFVHVFHVQLLWELNPNMAKSLEFEGCTVW